MDFALIFEGVSVVTAAAAMIAGGAIKAILLFASWASRKVATFFDDRSFWADRYSDHQVDSWANNREPMSLREFKASGQVTRAR